MKNLNLSGNSLRGTIPSALSVVPEWEKLVGGIGSLSNLETLDLSGNSLSGTIPSSVSDRNISIKH
ncbi:MAG: hypothetical protein GDA56_11105 [Hormoscilla sp. GM7CHS1pb]|nr:hypothetical protein [Hormoscilla sp. GM7CHS1pb]